MRVNKKNQPTSIECTLQLFASLPPSLPPEVIPEILQHLEPQSHQALRSLNRQSVAASRERFTQFKTPPVAGLDTWAQVLRAAPAIRAVRVDGGTIVGDRQCAQLLALPVLRDGRIVDLDLRNCTNLTHAGLPDLAALSALASLDLSGALITDATLAYVSGLVQLQKLTLDFCYAVSNTGLEQLQRLLQLTSLSLNGCSNITDAGLAHLAALVRMQRLNLFGCDKITNAGMVTIGKMTALEELTLSSLGDITAIGLAELKELTQMRMLNLSHLRHIHESGLHYLDGMQKLHTLDISQWTQLTDAGLDHVDRLRSLKVLNLTGCVQVTAAKVAQLRARGLTVIQ